MHTFLIWLNENQGIAQWLSVIVVGAAAYLAYRVGREQNKLNEFNSKFGRQPHVALEIKEIDPPPINYKMTTDFPNPRKWEIFIKNASISQHIRLVEYHYSDEGVITLSKGALIAAGGSYPIPLLGRNVKKDGSRKFLSIKFRASGITYTAQYLIDYNKDIAMWYWYKIEEKKDGVPVEEQE